MSAGYPLDRCHAARLSDDAWRFIDDEFADLADFDLLRHAHLDLMARAWQLRESVTVYDAMYVALAEALDATVVTCDLPLARAPGHRARVEAVQ